MRIRAFRFCDDLGPDKILHLYQPTVGLKAIVVIDNVAAGPSIGGVRMASDVTLEECVRLARAMTFKNAAAGLPHGGGKSVIVADPALDVSRKERLIRAFAAAIEPLTDYIPGPDMGLNETAMAWIRDEIGRSVGLPREVGGIPLDEIGATGFGLVCAADVAREVVSLDLDGARIAVQGFGAVGGHAAKFFSERGAILVAAADTSGTVHDAQGIDIDRLVRHKRSGRAIADFATGTKLERDAVIGVDCDILIPAARPDAIHENNMGDVKARLIVPGANIGITEQAEGALHRRGVLCVPDFIANAGGVICAAVEYAQGTEAQAFEAIEAKIRMNTAEVLERAQAGKTTPRDAAVAMAGDRLARAMRWQRFN